jgi:hypothetical protein
MTIVGNPQAVVGGVDTLDFHGAAAVDHVGGILGVESFEVTEGGCRRLLACLASFGEVAEREPGPTALASPATCTRSGSRSSNSIGPNVRPGIGTTSLT